MKIIQRVLIILLIAMFVVTLVPHNTVNADVDIFGKIDNINAKDPDANGTGKITDVVSSLLGFLQIASGLIAVVMIAATGFRYIIETPEMKSELKKSMIPIIVGILLVFFATSIAKFFISIFSK